MRYIASLILLISYAYGQKESQSVVLPELTLQSLLGADAGLQSLQTYSVPVSPSVQSVQLPPPSSLYSQVGALDTANRVALGRRLQQRRLAQGSGRPSWLSSRRLGYAGGAYGSGRSRVLGDRYAGYPQVAPVLPAAGNFEEVSIEQLQPQTPQIPVQGEVSELARKRQDARRQWLQLVVERNQLRRVQEIRKLEAEIARLKTEIASTAAATPDYSQTGASADPALDLSSYDFSNLAALVDSANLKTDDKPNDNQA